MTQYGGFFLLQAGMSIQEFAALMDVDQNYAKRWLETDHKVPLRAMVCVLYLCRLWPDLEREELNISHAKSLINNLIIYIDN